MKPLHILVPSRDEGPQLHDLVDVLRDAAGHGEMADEVPGQELIVLADWRLDADTPASAMLATADDRGQVRLLVLLGVGDQPVGEVVAHF